MFKRLFQLWTLHPTHLVSLLHQVSMRARHHLLTSPLSPLSLMHLLLILNSSSNFAIYCLMGPKFRSVLSVRIKRSHLFSLSLHQLWVLHWTLSVKFNNKNPSVSEIKDEIKDRKLTKKTCQIWMIKSCIPVCKPNVTIFPDKKIPRKLNLYQR